MRELSADKKLIQANLALFYPLSLLDSDEIRGLLEGSEALLDEDVVRNMRRSGVSLADVSTQGTSRLGALAAVWARQPEVVRRSGSAAISLVHSITRLEALHRDFFAPRPPPPPEPVSRDELLDFDELSG